MIERKTLGIGFRPRSEQRGIAFVLLIVAVLSVIAYATRTLAVSQIRGQREAVNRDRVETLESAIAVTQSFPAEAFAETLRMKMTDPTLVVEIQWDKSTSIVHASFFQKGKCVAKISRPRNTP